MLTQYELKTQFTYDPATGLFTRVKIRDRYGNLSECNYVITGDNGSRGYKRVSINGERYLLHKLVFLYVAGIYPESDVDHIDGNTSNNSFDNLRNCGKVDNRKNLKLYKNNSSGIVGVHFRNGKWYAQMQSEGKKYFKGYFDTIEEAVLARKELELLNNFHNNHGRTK